PVCADTAAGGGRGHGRTVTRPGKRSTAKGQQAPGRPRLSIRAEPALLASGQPARPRISDDELACAAAQRFSFDRLAEAPAAVGEDLEAELDRAASALEDILDRHPG